MQRNIKQIIENNFNFKLNINQSTQIGRLFLEIEKKNKLKISKILTYLNKGPVDAEKSIITSLEGKPVTIFDATNDSRVQFPEEAKKEGIASILSVPIPVKGNVIGVLRIYTSQPLEFTGEEIELVCSLAEMGGIAIENARMYNHLKMDYEGLFNDVHRWFDFGGPK